MWHAAGRRAMLTARPTWKPNNPMREIPRTDSTTYQRTIDRLQARYGEAGLPLYERNGVVYPLSLLPLRDVALDDLLSVEAPVVSIDRDTLPVYHEGLVKEIQAAGGTLYNGTTFAFERLATDPPRLHARLGTYYDHVATCIALERELLAGGPSPLRDALHREVAPATTMQTGAGRSAAIGVNALIVYRSVDGDYRVYIAERSKKTAHKPGALHVIPAFTFQPTDPDNPATAWDLRAGIRREYAEELFGVEEAEHGPQAAHPALVELDDMLADGRASLELTGMTCNLMTTHVSVCTLLMIHDAGWFPRLERWRTQHHPENWETERAFRIPMATDDPLTSGHMADIHLSLAPNGAAALWLGVDRAREKLKEGIQGTL